MQRLSVRSAFVSFSHGHAETPLFCGFDGTVGWFASASEAPQPLVKDRVSAPPFSARESGVWARCDDRLQVLRCQRSTVLQDTERKQLTTAASENQQLAPVLPSGCRSQSITRARASGKFP